LVEGETREDVADAPETTGKLYGEKQTSSDTLIGEAAFWAVVARLK